MQKLSKIISKKKYVQIPVKYTATGHLEIKAKLNGVKGVFILDTGASNTCIGLDKKDHFKVASKNSTIKASGAGATDMETQVSKKNSIKIGDWKTKKLQIVLFDLSHVNLALAAHNVPEVDGIVGADVLKQSKAIIDYAQSMLYLKRERKGNKS